MASKSELSDSELTESRYLLYKTHYSAQKVKNYESTIIQDQPEPASSSEPIQKRLFDMDEQDLLELFR